jgi:hypothetical protein
MFHFVYLINVPTVLKVFLTKSVNLIVHTKHMLGYHLNLSVLAFHLEVGTLMIPFAGLFLKKTSCKVPKSSLIV